MKINLKIEGPIAFHDLTCWLCEERPAVYVMHPHWIFRPCWGCQKKMILSQTFWERLNNWWLLKPKRIKKGEAFGPIE